MKFTHSLSSLIFLLPLLAQVHATPLSFKGGVAGNNGGAGGAAAAAAATATSSAAATAASSAASAASSATANNSNPQDSLTLDPKVVATGFENNGQDVPAAGQVASLTSANNFINFCLTVPNLPITNGQQIKTGSCNPAPMGIIAATTNMPSSKFVVPTNGQNFAVNQSFTVQMAVSNLDTGFFVNADENFFAAPQQTGSTGNIQGHSHIVIEAVNSFTDTSPTNPNVFAFFKGLNDPAANGQLTADVTSGLDAGTYRIASINTAANHQPALVSIAQHGALDDMVYFTVGGDGAAGNPFSGSGGAAGSTSASGGAASSAASGQATAASSAASSAAAAATSAASTGKGAQGQNAGKGGNQGAQGQANKGGNNAQGGNAGQQQPGRPKGGSPFKVRRDTKNRL
ncbi:uncharacterized protein PHACADRAFT_246383 [Phanerochaete carnosa HHB-10118-sp]|uniref:Uncharacterized protein n=1 Tax=Phanerochaete carnosa (strain HHB-10118-sp) TaxID=650164 RepID=K5WLY9_PHACS|nr:uncharacterized protein PHACADRAFT_246383 [Phanerochaete carnosa HHB-10118-sp]EKM60440.1 hypothetical protein PHACADRAFT_246383 [Phanerochaete carnosa HHB-10118-sp]